MDKVSRKAFVENGNGNPVAHAAADEIDYFMGENALGVVADYDDRKKTTASVLRPSSLYGGQCRIDESDTFAGKNSREDAADWLEGQS